jgi:fluoride exporter
LIGLYIGIGAALGAVFRWYLSLSLNSIFPTIPMGTLFSNILGGFLIGMFMGITKGNVYISETMRLMIVTGFLGGLTTFSTFSAETVNLITNQQYLWSVIMITGHVLGSIFATVLGIYFIKFFVFIWS